MSFPCLFGIVLLGLAGVCDEGKYDIIETVVQHGDTGHGFIYREKMGELESVS